MNNEKRNLITIMRDYLKGLSMSTQMILTVVLIFLIFFLLQITLNNYFFQNYYADKEFNSIENDLLQYVENMNDANADYYDEMYKFTSDSNAITVITYGDFYLYSSLIDDYTISVRDNATSNIYSVKIPNIDYSYIENEELHIIGYEFTDGVITPSYIQNVDKTYTFDSNIDCTTECVNILNAEVLSLQKPDNLNYEYEDSQLIQEELILLRNGTRELSKYSSEVDGEISYYYQTTIGRQNVIVFIHELGVFDYIVTMVPIEDTQNIIAIVSSYNNYVYITAILLIFAWSFRLSKVLTKPIQNIETVARQIADLNFDIEVHEYNNRENTSLSKSINLISKNLKETLDTLGTQNNELKELYDTQLKQVSLKKQLVSSISHELKTPLMIMQVTIQGILDGIIDKDDEDKELYNVLEEINKSSIMIQDMLQIYRLEDANTTLELSEFSLNYEIMSMISDFEQNIKKHNLKLDLNLDKSIMIEADHKLIKRVLSNYFTNAIKYTPEGERIYIEISGNENEIYFELTNYGVNIPNNDLDNIWMPFFRSQNYENNRLPTKGTGIGLYLVSEILKAHKAEYGIENIENGVKSYFRIKKQT